MLKCYNQSWLGSGHATFFSFATTTTRQGVRASVTSKFKAVVSKCSSRNEYNHNTVSNNFLAGKHGHVVAAVLSHAQLWFLRCTYLWHSRYRLQRNPCIWKRNFTHVFKYYVTKFYSYRLTTTVLWCTFPWFLWYCFSLIFVVLFFSFISFTARTFISEKQSTLFSRIYFIHKRVHVWQKDGLLFKRLRYK